MNRIASFLIFMADLPLKDFLGGTMVPDPWDLLLMPNIKVEKPPLPRWERVGVRVNKAAFQVLTSPSL